MPDGDLLRRAAERARLDPFYLASSLLTYARAERLDDAGLAASLGCDLETLPALLLCRRPTGRGAVFRADVEAIATRFRIDAARLARMIRGADALVSVQSTTADRTGELLAAARDHDGKRPQPAAEDEREPDGDQRRGSEADEGTP